MTRAGFIGINAPMSSMGVRGPKASVRIHSPLLASAYTGQKRRHTRCFDDARGIGNIRIHEKLGVAQPGPHDVHGPAVVLGLVQGCGHELVNDLVMRRVRSSLAHEIDEVPMLFPPLDRPLDWLHCASMRSKLPSASLLLPGTLSLPPQRQRLLHHFASFTRLRPR